MNIKLVIPIAPRTKKNSQQIIKIKNRYMIIPSKLYKQYEKDCKPYLNTDNPPINTPINMKCVYYMPTRRKCDLNNLLEATTDVFTHYGVIEDDNHTIVASHDGSRVYYDKDNPRTEVTITDFVE